MDYTQVIIKPLLTEKTMDMKESSRQVSFKVHPRANKIEIKNAVEKAFGVKVLAVNVVAYSSRDRKRQGRAVGREPGFKKAYVTLGQGDKIDLFEGV